MKTGMLLYLLERLLNVINAWQAESREHPPPAPGTVEKHQSRALGRLLAGVRHLSLLISKRGCRCPGDSRRH